MNHTAKLQIELPAHWIGAIETLAARERISINQLITTALAEKLSALMTEELLARRAERGRRAAFEAVLAKVAEGPADPGDEPVGG